MNDKERIKNDIRNSVKGDATGWLIILVLLFAVWPIGLILLIKKLSDLSAPWRNASARPSVGESTDSADSRLPLYFAAIRARREVPLSDLAEAAGVPEDVAMREIHRLISAGRFGHGAYFDYITKTLVLGDHDTARADRTPEAEAQSGSFNASDAAPAVCPETGYGKITYPLLLGLGILLLVGGIVTAATALDSIAFMGLTGATFTMWWELVKGVGLAAGGIASLVSSGSIHARRKRLSRYRRHFENGKLVDIKKLSRMAGVRTSAAVKDLEFMAEKGWLGKNAYIDHSTMSLILDPAVTSAPSDKKTEQPEEDSSASQTESNYDAILREIRELNDRIDDDEVSRRIETIETLTARIFAVVEEKPEKLPQIKSFMNYYLPTTLKLLRSYATFERQNISGENIDKAKADISRILDTLAKGYSQQLDKLFADDVLDISSDIEVLESMMKKDGLSGGGRAFAAGGH